MCKATPTPIPETQSAMDTTPMNLGHNSTQIDTLLCHTIIHADLPIDHVAISEGGNMVMVGRYEIPTLIKHLQTLYDINKEA